MPTVAQLEAISAAVHRVYPLLNPSKFEVELAWCIQDIKYEHDGSILWRGFELGRLLFERLSEAQNWRCCYCGVRTNNLQVDMATIEHVVPKSKGGLDHPDNMVMACKMCNLAQSKTKPN